MEHAIIEFKAYGTDYGRIRAILQNRDARFVGVDHQVDTYFRVPHGRLKMREGNIENALVFYSRPNQAGPKQSDVTMSAVPRPSEMRAVLAKALGVLVAVDKQGEIYLVENVRIHLDVVAKLGQFVEVEAIGQACDTQKLREQCEGFRREFGVTDLDLVDVSYGDLLMRNA